MLESRTDDGEGGDGADEVPAVRGQLRHVAAPPAPGDVAPVLLFLFLVRGIHALPDEEAHHVEPVQIRTDVNGQALCHVYRWGEGEVRTYQSCRGSLRPPSRAAPTAPWCAQEPAKEKNEKGESLSFFVASLFWFGGYLPSMRLRSSSHWV